MRPWTCCGKRPYWMFWLVSDINARRAEILRRSRAAAVSLGKRTNTKGLGSDGDRYFIYQLLITKPDAVFRIFYIKNNDNLRIRLTVLSQGHHVSYSVADFRGDNGTWHHTGHNETLLTALREMMVLEDLADV